MNANKAGSGKKKVGAGGAGSAQKQKAQQYLKPVRPTAAKRPMQKASSLIPMNEAN